MITEFYKKPTASKRCPTELTISKKSLKELDLNTVKKINITNTEATNSDLRLVSKNISHDSHLSLGSDQYNKGTCIEQTVNMRHRPKLYPPGRILHVVRKYPRTAFDNRNR